MDIKKKTFDFRLKEIGETGEFSGYGAVFGNIDHHRDVIHKGAFARSLKEHGEKGTWPMMFLNHYDKEIGEYLEIKEDDIGLFLRGKLWVDGPHPDPDALKAYRGMKKERGKMGLSIGFMPYEGGEEFNKAGGYYDLKALELFEISPVYFPANDLARVEAVKTASPVIPEEREELKRIIDPKRRGAYYEARGWI